MNNWNLLFKISQTAVLSTMIKHIQTNHIKWGALILIFLDILLTTNCLDITKYIVLRFTNKKCSYKAQTHVGILFLHLNKFTLDHWSRILMISISNQTCYPWISPDICFKLKPWLFATHLLSLAKLKLILLKFKTSECSLKT